MSATKTVLIIDDEALVRELYSVKFKRAGFTVLEADGGESGLRQALSARPDLIVLDILMPKMNGYEVLRKLRTDKEWGARVPVIVLTNDKLDDDAKVATLDTVMPAYFFMKTTVLPEDLVSKAIGILKQGPVGP